MSYELNEVAQHWNQATEGFSSGRLAGLFWWDAGPEIHNRINYNISGNPDCDYTTYTLKKYFGDKLPLERCLSLGCGAGSLERSLAKQKAFRECDAYDVSDGSIKEADKVAKEEGFDNINYHITNINTINLPSNTYEAVWIQGAMHHFDALEHVCQQIKQALKPGGLLILNEYVGPNRFQFSARQKEIANLCLQLLPIKYRYLKQETVEKEFNSSTLRNGGKWFIKRLNDKVKDGSLLRAVQRRISIYKNKFTGQAAEKATITFPTSLDVIAADPSEAIRSGDIVKVLQQYFNIIEKKDLGGNILQFLLADIAGNFAKGGEEAQALLKMLINIEETLLLSGEFESDFAYIVARP